MFQRKAKKSILLTSHKSKNIPGLVWDISYLQIIPTKNVEWCKTDTVSNQEKTLSEDLEKSAYAPWATVEFQICMVTY